MSEAVKTNYEIAKAEADKVDEIIIETLKQGVSFRVEAGAGSGKTYSLNRVIEWIQSNKWSEFQKKKPPAAEHKNLHAHSNINIRLHFDNKQLILQSEYDL